MKSVGISPAFISPLIPIVIGTKTQYSSVTSLNNVLFLQHYNAFVCIVKRSMKKMATHSKTELLNFNTMRNKYILPALIIAALVYGNSVLAQNNALVTTNNNVIIPCGSSCVTLSAVVTPAAATTQYTVSPIPYDSLICFNCGTQVLDHTDDLYSVPVNIPFTFCFFGNVYNQFIIGANGMISFNTASSGSFNSWQIPGPIPRNTPADVQNSIMAPWQDVDPTNTGGIYYNITGTAPNRTMQISWYRIPMYGDPNSVNLSYCPDTIFQTQMIVLHETTMSIDINIQSKGICPNWNNGFAIEGIQDATGTSAYAVPGRNATQWTAANDAWSFTPAGASSYATFWYQNSTLLANTDTVTVCPTVATQYMVQAKYYLCNNDSAVINDTVNVTPDGPPTSAFTTTFPVCTGVNSIITYTGNAPTSATYNWNFSGGTIVSGSGQGPYQVNWSTGGTKPITLTVIDGSCTSTITTELVVVNISPVVSFSGLSASYCVDASTVVLTGVPAGGVFSGPGISGGTFTAASAGVGGPYTISYSYTDANSCSNTAGQVTTVYAQPVVQLPSVQSVACYGDSTGNFCATTTGGLPPFTFLWNNFYTTSCLTNQAPGIYTIVATDINGCSASAITTVIQPAQILFDSVIVTNATCYMNAGTLCTYVSGGTSPYQYHWGNGGLGSYYCANLSPSATAYVTTVTDAHGCSVTTSDIVGGPGPLIDSVEVTNSACSSNNGAIQIFTSTAGVLPYKFTIDYFNTFQSTGLFSNLSPGFYPIWVIDSTGCQDSVNIQVNQATSLHIDSNIITSVSCFGVNNGAACPYVSGGTPAYTYMWSDGENVPCIIHLLPAIYRVTITDAVGCTVEIADTITQSAGLHIDSNIITSVSCFGTNNGTACPYVSGGTPSYTYQWSDGENVPCIIHLLPAIYRVTITDAIGCSVVIADTITQSAALHIDSNFVDQISCYGLNNGAACALISGGTPYISGYIYHWSNSATTQCLSQLSPGIYVETVTDSLGCTLVINDTITQPAMALTCTISANSDTIHSSDTIHYGQDSLTVHVSGGTPAYIYIWNTGDTRNPMPIWMCGNYVITVTDQNGCTATANDSSVVCLDNYVWPGDANYDGIADNNDLLTIGVAYGATGSVRPNASLTWIGQPSPDWAASDTLPNGVNYKNADCDGNGVINADDTLAIIQNWGQTHIRGGGMNEWRNGIPALVVNLVPDTAYTGDTVNAEMILGDSSIIANNVYGLAFTLNYDPTVVDTTKTVTSFGNSWLGSSNDKISINKDFKLLGKIQCAITRIDHTSRSGGGQIGSTAFVITTDNINGKNYSFYTMRAWISNVTMIDNAGNILQVNEGMDTTMVGYFPTGITPVANDNNRVQIFPNPANNNLMVTSEIAAIEIKITDVLDKEVITYIPQNAHYTQLDVSELSNGIYFVEVMTGKGVSTQRVVIAR